MCINALPAAFSWPFSSTMPPRSLPHKPDCVLVTGGAGFIGSNFLLRMVRRYAELQFVNLDKLTYAGNLMNLHSIERESNYTFVRGDVGDLELVSKLFARYQFMSVVHFAAESHVDRSIRAPLAFVQSNILGTVTLLDSARRHWDGQMDTCRFLHVSTDEVFGALGEEGYFTLASPYAPRSPYSASKAAADHFVRAYANTYGLPIIISNCSNNFGPYQFPEKLIPLVILCALDRRPVPVYGKGENVRDWLHVEDHCAALEKMLTHGAPGTTYLVGGSSETSNLDIVRLLLNLVDEAMGRAPGASQELITFVADRPGHDFRYAIDARQTQKDLGWTPSYSLEAGLRQTVNWYLTNQDWLNAVNDQSYQAYLSEQYSI